MSEPEIKNICPSCQAELTPSTHFCPNCGKPVAPQAEAKGVAASPNDPVPELVRGDNEQKELDEIVEVVTDAEPVSLADIYYLDPESIIDPIPPHTATRPTLKLGTMPTTGTAIPAQPSGDVPSRRVFDEVVRFMINAGWTVEAQTPESATFSSSRSGRRVSLGVEADGSVKQFAGDRLDLSEIRARLGGRGLIHGNGTQIVALGGVQSPAAPDPASLSCP